MQQQLIAIDIGYGDTKVCTMNTDGTLDTFKFPSAVARMKESQVNFGDSNVKDSYLFNGKRFLVGDNAKNDAMSTRGFSFLQTYGPLVSYHAILKAGLDITQPIYISLGLSIMNWQQRDEFLDALKKFTVDNNVIEPDIYLLAQGQGILADYQGDTSGIICVVDIGYNTFDFLVFEDGKPRPDLSYADPIGANKMITDLQAITKRRFNVHVTEQMAKEIFINGTVQAFGDTVDFKEEIAELKENYNEFIIDELKAKNSNILFSAKKIIFSGGGAYFLENTKLPNNVVFSQKPYEFSNVRGYFKKLIEVNE